MTSEDDRVRIGERLRQEVARVLDLAAEDVPDETNLIEIGLHSLAIMTLIGPLSQLARSRLDYADLAGTPTVRAWSALIEIRCWDAGGGRSRTAIDSAPAEDRGA